MAKLPFKIGENAIPQKPVPMTVAQMRELAQKLHKASTDEFALPSMVPAILGSLLVALFALAIFVAVEFYRTVT